MVVDDEVAHLRALSSVLAENGYDVASFESPIAALAAFQQLRVEILITDLRMPEMDGIALLHSALEIQPYLVGIVMTGEGTIATAIGAMKEGAFDYVLKPFNLATILPIVARARTVYRLRVANAELQAELRERIQELELANLDLEAFTNSVAHDLRAPLNVIAGFSEALLTDRTGAGAAEPRRLIERIDANARRMQHLIEDLLQLSRLGRRPLERAAVNVSELVREAVAELREGDPSARTEIRVGDLPACLGDCALLKQVFINLIGNAIKFSRNAEAPLVEIEGSRAGSESEYCVRDNGAGFDSRYSDQLFRPFSRLHPEREFEGTGIGLTIVDRVVRRHGGRIFADGSPGKGATFRFRLPD